MPKAEKLFKRKLLILVLGILIISNVGCTVQRKYPGISNFIPKIDKIVKVLEVDLTKKEKKDLLVATVRSYIMTHNREQFTVREGYLYVFTWIGHGYAEKCREYFGEELETLVVEDINQDGIKELITGWLGGKVVTYYVFPYNEIGYRNKNLLFYDTTDGEFELKDIDNDGIKEILFDVRDPRGQKKLASFYYRTDIYKWDGKKYYLYKTEKIAT